MFSKSNTQPAIDKNSQEYWLRQVSTARHALVIVAAFTVVNLALFFLDANSYFLFSASIPYYLTVLGYAIDDYVFGAATSIMMAIGAVFLAMALVCFLEIPKQAGRKNGWLITAVVLFVADTAFLLFWALVMVGGIVPFITDLVFHGLILWELCQGIVYNRKLIAKGQEEQPLSKPHVELD